MTPPSSPWGHPVPHIAKLLPKSAAFPYRIAAIALSLATLHPRKRLSARSHMGSTSPKSAAFCATFAPDRGHTRAMSAPDGPPKAPTASVSPCAAAFAIP